jgi:hypothetical protein
MSHQVSLDDLYGFDTRSIIAMSTEDKKKLELVCLQRDGFKPMFLLTSKKGTNNFSSLDVAIEYYNRA